MSKANKLLRINVIVLVMLAVVLVSLMSGMSMAKAETQDGAAEPAATADERGIFVTLSLSMTGDDNGHIIATVRNDFTLGYSTVIVMVELYSSYTYETDVNNMTFEARNRTEDLNIYESISIAKETGGEQKYWVAQLEYKQDSKPWKATCTAPVLFDANGSPVK